MFVLANPVFALEITPIKGLRFVIRELAIEFEIEKFLGTNLDKGTFKIWGLNASHRDAVKKPYNPNLTKGPDVRLLLGYGEAGAQSLVYLGQAIEVRSWLEGQDWCTQFDTSTAYKEMIKDLVAESFAPGTGPKDVIKKMADKADLDWNFFGDLKKLFEKRFINGKSFWGNLKGMFDELTGDFKDKIAITTTSEGEIQVTQIGMPNKDKAVLLQADSGLLGVPQPTKLGCNFTALLNPLIRPSTPLMVKSKSLVDYGLNYTAKKVKHKGSFNKGDSADIATTEVEALFYPSILGDK